MKPTSNMSNLPTTTKHVVDRNTKLQNHSAVSRARSFDSLDSFDNDQIDGDPQGLVKHLFLKMKNEVQIS